MKVNLPPDKQYGKTNPPPPPPRYNIGGSGTKPIPQNSPANFNRNECVVGGESSAATPSGEAAGLP